MVWAAPSFLFKREIKIIKQASQKKKSEDDRRRKEKEDMFAYKEKVLCNLVYSFILLLPFVILAGCASLIYAVEGNLMDRTTGVLFVSILVVCSCVIVWPGFYVKKWMRDLKIEYI